MTRIINLLKAVRLELKITRRYVFLGILLLTSMLAAAIFIAFVSNNIMPTFTRYVNSMFPNGINLQINGLTYDNIDMLNEISFEEIYPAPEESADAETFYFGDTSLESCYIKLCYFKEENNNVKNGKGFDTECNVEADGEIPIWVSEDVSKEYGMALGDKIQQQLSENMILIYSIRGIYSDSRFIDADMGIPFTAYYQAVSATGRHIEHQIYGVISDAADYSSICKEVSKLGLSAYSSIDDTLNVLNTFRSLFLILSIFVTITAALTFSNICGVIFRHRLKHIMLEKILGRKDRETVFIYGFIIELTIIISLGLALIIDIYLQSYAENILIDTFGTSTLVLSGISDYIPIAFIVCNIILIRSFANILRITRRSNIISALEDKG